MELISILLSGIFSFLSFGGIIVDKNAESTIKEQLSKTENLEVRVDNAPMHQILGGKINKVSLSGKGLWLTPQVRIDRFELETDSLDIDLSQIKREDLARLKLSALKKPLQAGVKVSLQEADINKALKSTEVLNQVQKVAGNILGRFGGSLGKNYQIYSPQVKFLDNNRLGMSVELRDDQAGDKLNVNIESGLGIVGGKKIKLNDPKVVVNGLTLPSFFLTGLLEQLDSQLSLDQLESRGVTARILDLKISNQKLDLAAFVKFDPQAVIKISNP
jgi:hypothetical protein